VSTKCDKVKTVSQRAAEVPHAHMSLDEVHKYWDSRAAADPSEQATTMDVYMRAIEWQALEERIPIDVPLRIADVGCGDARTTVRLCANRPTSSFAGIDYSVVMLAVADRVRAEHALSNLEFCQLDVCDGLDRQYDYVITTRCLINIPEWDLQKKALANIHRALAPGGVFLMIENFVEGHENMNRVRLKFGLPEIPIRDHNLFFRRQELLDYVHPLFDVLEEVNISSMYYLVSRVVYSRICADAGVTPDYFNAHHQLAAKLPHCGEFGPVRIMSMKKRQ